MSGADIGECLDRVLSQVSVDYASLYEPIASNAGPVISPEMFERFLPYAMALGVERKWAAAFADIAAVGEEPEPGIWMLESW